MLVDKINQNVAVRVRNGCKSYGLNTILDNLDMTVPSGSTYALLGSSGCGKTTLLSSLVGMRKLSSGSVQLFGQDATQADIISLVGFMPQEIGLHRELTFSEEFHYYGRLYGLDWTEAEERLTFFMNLLQLVEVKDREIRNMSGGQARRVSLAITLLHRPSLIILDEPTVGVDPLLRESIWEHLYALVKEENATIIVSTHYTEEARQADVVSVMRNGKLLVEENPTTLMIRYGSDLLEDIVVKLCRSQENGNYDNYQNESDPTEPIIHTAALPSNMDNITIGCSNVSNVIAMTKDKTIVNISYKQWKNSIGYGRDGMLGTKITPSTKKKGSWLSYHLQKIYAIFILNFILILRNPAILGFQIILPTVDMAMTWGIYSQDPLADIGVVNLEQANCFGLNQKEDVQKLGCELSHYLQESKTLTLQEYQSEEAALEAVHWGKNYGYILLPSNYSRNLKSRVAFGRFADKEVLDGSTISARLDMSNYLRNLILLNGLVKGMEGFSDKKLNGSTEANVITSLKPFKMNEKMKELGGIEGTWENAAAVSRTALFTWIQPTTIALTLIQDRQQGSLFRTLVGGGTLQHVFIATMAASFLSMFVAQVGFLLAISYGLGIPFKGSIVDYIIVNYGQSLGGLSFGFFLGSAFHHQLEAIFGLIAVSMVALIGHVGDVSGVAPGMMWFVLSLPTKVPSMSIENIMFRGWSIWSHFHVWSCFIVQAAWILPCLLLARFSFGKTQA